MNRYEVADKYLNDVIFHNYCESLFNAVIKDKIKTEDIDLMKHVVEEKLELIMRKTPITQEEFERAFWFDENGESLLHECLCRVFVELHAGFEFIKFWSKINTEEFLSADEYLDLKLWDTRGLYLSSTFRLMIAQEFIEQFNSSLGDKE